MPIAFKEWAVTVRALAEGEQLLTLRKAGLREPGKPFKLAHERFFLYPTFEHQSGDLVRESHQPELRRALEEGVWSDGEPLLGAFTSGAPVQQPDRVRIRAWAEVADHFTIADPRCVDALSPFYVWAPDSGTSTSRGPAASMSATSKPRERRSMQGMPSSSSSPSMNSASL